MPPLSPCTTSGFGFTDDPVVFRGEHAPPFFWWSVFLFVLSTAIFVWVPYDGGVGDDRDGYVQFVYGEDGVESVWIQDPTMELMPSDNEEMDEEISASYATEGNRTEEAPPRRTLRD